MCRVNNDLQTRANYIIINTVSSESKFQWQFPVAIQLFPAGLLLIGMFFLPETPRFLMTQRVGILFLSRHVAPADFSHVEIRPSGADFISPTKAPQGSRIHSMGTIADQRTDRIRGKHPWTQYPLGSVSTVIWKQGSFEASRPWTCATGNSPS